MFNRSRLTVIASPEIGLSTHPLRDLNIQVSLETEERERLTLSHDVHNRVIGPLKLNLHPQRFLSPFL